MKAIIKNQNLIPFAQPALQLGRQGTGDERDRNCALAGFTLQTLSNATRRAEEIIKVERVFSFENSYLYIYGRPGYPNKSTMQMSRFLL
jgi:hypothetical protein